MYFWVLSSHLLCFCICYSCSPLFLYFGNSVLFHFPTSCQFSVLCKFPALPLCVSPVLITPPVSCYSQCIVYNVFLLQVICYLSLVLRQCPCVPPVSHDPGSLFYSVLFCFFLHAFHCLRCSVFSVCFCLISFIKADYYLNSSVVGVLLFGPVLFICKYHRLQDSTNLHL